MVLERPKVSGAKKSTGNREFLSETSLSGDVHTGTSAFTNTGTTITKGIHPYSFNLKAFFKSVNKEKLLGSIIVVNWVIIVGLLGFIIFTLVTDKDSYIISIPGWVNANKYKTLTDERDQLIDENSLKIRQNQEIQQRLNTEDLPFEEGYQLISTFVSNFETIQSNMQRISEIDTNLLSIDLPEKISSKIVTVSDENQTSIVKLSQSLPFYQASEDYFNLRVKKEEADKCIQNIDLTQDPDKIAESISSCAAMYDNALAEISNIETQYNTSLPNIRRYIETTKAMWAALSEFYIALSQEDYRKEKEYDDLYLTKEAELEALGVETIWFEYKDNILNVLQPVSEAASMSNFTTSDQ